MYQPRIKLIVDNLREEHGLTTAPINIKKLAKNVGVEIMEENFNELLSGFVYQKHGNKLIGINSKHSALRKRFTVAHEIGHLYLHKTSSVNYDKAVMMFRDSHASEGTDTKEIQANQFAAELLMPQDLIREDIKKAGIIDLTDDKFIDKLAKKYQVSSQAMAIRLSRLYYFK
jgi:Zn-dependent peptidase ImmA (M78 family)